MRGAFTETTAGELVHAGLLQQRGGGTLVYASRGVERVFTTRRTTAAATAAIASAASFAEIGSGATTVASAANIGC